MRKFLLSIGLCIGLATLGTAQVTIMLEDFEDATVEYSISPAGAEFSDGSEDYLGIIGIGGITVASGVVINNIQGSGYLGAQDIDGDGEVSPQTLLFEDIDISGYSSLQLRVYLAEDDDGANQDWDSSDYVRITGDIDDGTTQNFIWVENDGTDFNAAPSIDTDFNGDGDGTEITDTFVQFTANITGTGDLLDLSIEIALNSGDEDIAIDNVEIIGTNSNSISLTTAVGYRLLSATTDISYSTLLDAIWTQGASTGADATNGDPNVFEWDNTSSGGANTNWTGLTDLSSTIVAGEGFLVYVYADDDYDGSDDAFPKTLTLNTGSAHAEDASPTINSNADSWTLLGNPFNETIDFDNLTTSDITGTLYIWDPNASSWETWNGSVGDITNGLIAVSQGFFVQTVSSPTSASVTFPSGSKSTGGTFYGKTTENLSYMRFEAQGDEVSNSAWIQLSEEGSLTQKVKGDALELEPLATKFAQLGFNKGEEVFDIAHINFPEEEVHIPVTFNTTVDGNYTLTATDFVIPGDLTVVFHDYDEGISLEVDDLFAYAFSVTQQLKARDESPLTSLNGGIIQAEVEENRFAITIRPASVSNELGETPLSFGLEQNYPNPFNPSTTINYSVENAGNVNISVYNLMGQKVATLVNEAKAAGSYSVRWNAAGAASGMYYYRLEAGGQSITRKMTLIK